MVNRFTLIRSFEMGHLPSLYVGNGHLVLHMTRRVERSVGIASKGCLIDPLYTSVCVCDNRVHKYMHVISLAKSECVTICVCVCMSHVLNRARVNCEFFGQDSLREVEDQYRAIGHSHGNQRCIVEPVLGGGASSCPGLPSGGINQCGAMVSARVRPRPSATPPSIPSSWVISTRVDLLRGRQVNKVGEDSISLGKS